jgi:hypothetical protein
LALVLIEFFYLIVVIPNIGMARIVHVHHVDKEAYLKGNIEPDPDELDLVFERTHTYAEVLEQVRIELNWMDLVMLLSWRVGTTPDLACTSVGR